MLPQVRARTVDMPPALVGVGGWGAGQLFVVIEVSIAIPLISLVIILVQELWVKPQETAALAVVEHSGRPAPEAT